MAKVPKVALLIETSEAFGQRLMRGIAKYSLLYGPWTFYRELPSYRKRVWKKKKSMNIKEWGVDGAIAFIPDLRKACEVIFEGVPTIVAHDTSERTSVLPTLVSDNLMIGKMAAEYFLGRGFRKFAYFGYDDLQWSHDRKESFSKVITKAGYEVQDYKQPKLGGKRKPEMAYVIEWLRSLPKPVAMMTCNDYCGQNIIEACKDAGIHIPEEIAVMGSDDDYIVCDFTNPKLSSISYNTEKAGYEAAELLDKLMTGEQKMTGQQIIIHPARIVTRQSTDILAIEDKEVAAAVRFIDQHCKEPIQVDEVAAAVFVSRRSLERRFKIALDKTIHDEIRRAHINKVAEMLIETNTSILNIAMSLGYHGTAHIARAFRQEKGMSLRAYRKKYGQKPILITSG